MSSEVDAKLHIGGQWQEARGGNTFDVVNPSDGSVFATVSDGSREDAVLAIDAAASAQAAWAAESHITRAKIMWKAAEIVESRQKELAMRLVEESGSWIGKAMYESGYVANVFRAAGAAAYQVTGEIVPSEYDKVSMIIRQPLGVVSVISPWNFPMLLSSRGLAVPLAIGNAVILKPSEETPITGGTTFAEVLEEAGLPAGVLNVVTCSRKNVSEVGDEIIENSHIKAVSFTGSTAVGRQVAAKAGLHLKKACMELGGKDALVVLEDADLERAVDAAVFGSFMHQGQICMSVERIVVQGSIADEFVERFAAKARTLKVGDPKSTDGVIGPVINSKQLAKIDEQVSDARDQGAEILAGGTYSDLFYQPTVIDNVTSNMRVFREETFGPVAGIVRVESIEQAIDIANDSEYGLSAGVITQDEKKGLAVARQLQTGMVHVNDCSVFDEPHIPFGGVKNSGLGRHGGRAAIDTFTETRWVTLERGGRNYPPPFRS